jgi:predicted secreted protein
LPGDPKRGFRWEIDQVDERVLLRTGPVLYVPNSDPSLSGGMFYFTFTGGPGMTTLRLVYRRANQEKAAPAKVFLALVTVD